MTIENVVEKETEKRLKKEKEQELLFRNLRYTLNVLKDTTQSVVDWKNDMRNTIKILEDTGNYNFRLEFIKNKIKELDDRLEKETAKLSLEIV